MAHLALISSHAPWTPLPRLVPWEQVGDGAIFDGTQRDGASKRAVWADRNMTRDHYAKSLDYSLATVGEYLERYADDALFIILGDHAPLPIVNGNGGTFDVPIHMVSADRALLDRLGMDHWTDGMRPAPDKQSLPMEAMRSMLAERFGSTLTMR